MNQEAVFCDGTKEYRIPWEPKAGERVKIRLRVARGEQAQISLIHEGETLPMTLSFARNDFDYYETTVQLTDQWYAYYFELQQQGQLFYYDRAGLTEQVRREYDFGIMPGFSTPDWAKGAVMYQILVDRFYNGDPSNDVEDREYYYISTYAANVRDWENIRRISGWQNFTAVI